MGVPALFRWLSSKYSKIIYPVAQDKDEAGEQVDLMGANPNGIEFDNLYLDMNGIIHPCSHPMDKPAPANEQLMMIEVFKYIDHIFSMIRPRKLLYMAIDGVAPRAKMNQQRSRRFRAAQERRTKIDEDEDADGLSSITSDSLNSEEENGDDDDDDASALFDSNCITPGTEFMDLVAKSLRYYVVSRMNSDPAWKRIKVIISDANVPGEGEHKIVDYIRRQRMDPMHDANTKHVIYGLDADLIMLALATHEVHFRVLREDVFAEDAKRRAPCTICRQRGHIDSKCPARSEADIIRMMQRKTPFIFLDVGILREYLTAELAPSRDQPFPYPWTPSFAIDDWIFLCFLVGNDFLPHLPSLDLREGAIDLLIDIYKKKRLSMTGFLTRNGDVNLNHVQLIFDGLAEVEDRIFEQRHAKEERMSRNSNHRRPDPSPSIIAANQEANAAAAQALLAGNPLLMGANGSSSPFSSNSSTSSIASAAPVDAVRLWEPGARQRYYERKFNLTECKESTLTPIVKSYIEGLCWVLKYYYQGCAAWRWFYPYHFAPLASDLRGIAKLNINFDVGRPFRPFDQLMSVFPSDSQALVPAAFRTLMTDSDSPIADFYPRDFAVDMDGKRHAWQGVALLPFVDEERLLDALKPVYATLTPEEIVRSELGSTHLFMTLFHPGATALLQSLGKDATEHTPAIPLDPARVDGMSGSIKKCIQHPPLESQYPSPLPLDLAASVEDLEVLCFVYFPSFYNYSQFKHRSGPLPGGIPNAPTLTMQDLEDVASGAASRRVRGRLILTPHHQQQQQRHHSMYEDVRTSQSAAETGLPPVKRGRYPPPEKPFAAGGNSQPALGQIHRGRPQ